MIIEPAFVAPAALGASASRGTSTVANQPNEVLKRLAFPQAAPPRGSNTSRHAMHIAARDCKAWGFGLGFALNEVGGR